MNMIVPSFLFVSLLVFCTRGALSAADENIIIQPLAASKMGGVQSDGSITGEETQNAIETSQKNHQNVFDIVGVIKKPHEEYTLKASTSGNMSSHGDGYTEQHSSGEKSSDETQTTIKAKRSKREILFVPRPPEKRETTTKPETPRVVQEYNVSRGYLFVLTPSDTQGSAQTSQNAILLRSNSAKPSGSSENNPSVIRAYIRRKSSPSETSSTSPNYSQHAVRVDNAIPRYIVVQPKVFREEPAPQPPTSNDAERRCFDTVLTDFVPCPKTNSAQSSSSHDVLYHHRSTPTGVVPSAHYHLSTPNTAVVFPSPESNKLYFIMPRNVSTHTDYTVSSTEAPRTSFKLPSLRRIPVLDRVRLTLAQKLFRTEPRAPPSTTQMSEAPYNLLPSNPRPKGTFYVFRAPPQQAHTE